ncbi:deleted in malignant brain tumors 1 protein-like isoform X2 [Zootoca vivipara]|uniref:deleted in malignant brain tumors 1 protein-like isoform X2 n=1 Tax=Zootoca vivipara TaxID=8524 RepID=UPI00293BC756|nr:deleted in malignant brain tumors 1 protein-like isoform X2 [Zootoca vivipara]
MDHIVIFLWVLLSASGVKSATTAAKDFYSCGKTFTDPSGSFTLPYYNGGGDVVECLWTIVSDYKIPIVLTLDYFSLDCTREYIRIYDGLVRHSALLGQICGGSSQVFVSRSGIMKVVLHRESYRASSGFFGYYDITDLVTSTVPELTTAPELTTGPLYTTTLPAETTNLVTSAVPELTTAPELTTGPLYTTALPAETTNLVTSTVSELTSAPFQCGGVLLEPFGYIYGPYYPGYGRPMECTWEIKAPQFYERVVLQFKTIGWNLNCRTDYIAIYDGGLGSSRKLGRICMFTRHVFISTSDTMTVVLYRNSSNAGLSFTAYYYTTPQETTTEQILQETTTGHIDTTSVTLEATTEATTAAVLSTTGEPTTLGTESPSTPSACGGYLSLPNGSISGPYYPGNGAIVQCIWEIQVSPGYQIVLQLSYISLNCKKEYIKIFDGYAYASTLLGRICSGIYLNYTYTSTYNTMTIVLYRDSYYSGNGFYASYASIPLRIETTTAPPLNESTTGIETTTAPPLNESTTGIETTTAPPLNESTTALSCSGEYMLAHISRDYLGLLGYNASEVSLNTSDPFCSPEITQEYVVFKIPYSGCGTVRKQSNNDTITYTNIIKTSASGYIITRRKNFQFHIMCEMNAKSVVETMFIAQNSIDITERKHGNYSVALSFYESSSFDVSVRSFPYVVPLDQVLYLQATLNSSDPNLVLFLDTCVTSPYPGDFTTLTYDLIKHGCVRDPTFLNLRFNSSNNNVRFKFNSFKFLYEHNQIYLQCKLVVCKAYDYSSRCYQGCLTRRKRETDNLQDKVDVVVGPVKLRKETNEDKRQELAKSVNLEKKEALSPLTVTTVLLAAMVFVLSGLLISSKLRRKNYHQIY